jgi:hypothetical protein
VRSIFVAVLTLCACADSSALVTEGKTDESGSTQKAEQWASNDDPSLFGATLTRVPAQLPATGAAQTSPWAGSYWPTYLDNINAQWAGDGSDSAAMKYQKAFGGSNVEDAVSAFRGIDSATTQKTCMQSSECDATNGETCAMRRGKTTGRCVPTWWGICHAWSPAAIMLPEPKHAVTRNGITFEVPDLKALGSLVFDGASAEFVSSRCNLVDGNIALDAYGRPSNANPECRDTNPGTMHLLLTNYLGLRHQAFVEDRVADAQVWNQPLRGYRVTQQQSVTATQANVLVGATSVGGATTHSSGTVAQGAWAGANSFPVMAGTHVKVQMTGDGDADLYVRFGAAPDLQTYDCRPYVNGTGESCDLDTPAGQTTVFVSVNGYAASSNFQLDVTIGGSVPTSYVFNADAKGFLQVTTQVDYIGESQESQGYIGTGIDAYTQTDTYTYVLELDAAGNIIGGEWTGDSKMAHPDFMWLPNGPGQATVANGAISYANVKSLIDESVVEPAGRM